MPYGVDFCKFGPKALAYGPPIIPHAALFVNSKNIQKIIKNFYKIYTICLLTRKVNSNIAQKIGANLSKKQKSKLKKLAFSLFFWFSLFDNVNFKVFFANFNRNQLIFF